MGLINNIIALYKINKYFNERRFKEVARLIDNLDDPKLKEKWKFKLQFENDNFEFKIKELERKNEYEKVLRLLSTLYDSKYKKEYIESYIRKLYELGCKNYYEYSNYDKAKQIFEAIVDYKDAAKLFKQCYNKVEYKKATLLFKERRLDDAFEIFDKLGDYENSKEFKEKCEKEIKYKKALKYIEKEQLKEAAEILKDITRYKDSMKLLVLLESKIKLKENNVEIIESTGNTNDVEINDEQINSGIENKKKIKINYSEYYKKGILFFNNKNYEKAKENFTLCGNYKDSIKYINKCDEETKKIYFYKQSSYIFNRDKIEFVEKNALKLVILYNKTTRKYVYCACFSDDEQPHKEFYYALAKSKLEKIKQENTFLLMDSEFYIVYCSLFGGNIKEDFFVYEYLNSNINQVDNKSFRENISKMLVIDDVDELLKSASEKTSDILECVKAYTGELELYKTTRDKLESISELIENSVSLNEELKILIQGSARSGKTIIALELLRYYSQFKFLLMNYYFYRSLRDVFKAKNLEFPSDRIFHHDLGKDHNLGCGINKGEYINNYKKSFKFSTDYIIVDEAQRLSNLISHKYPSFYERDILLLESKIGIFLGDDLQKINPEFDDGFGEITKILQLKKRKYYNYEFDGSIGIPSSLVNAYKYILKNDEQYLDNIKENKIILYNNSVDFKNDFDSNLDNSKHYSTITSYSISYDFIKLGLRNLPYDVATNDQCFLNKKYINDCVLNTFDVISRDLHCMYLIIPDEISYSEKNGIFHKYGFSKKYTPLLINHLYVNMTRATEKLVIYTKDTDLFNYLEKQIKKVCSNFEINNNSKATVVEQKINFVKSYSDKSDNLKLYDKWKRYNFEGFVHATDYMNVINILKENKLKSRRDVTGIFQDIADQGVIVKTSNFVTSKVRFYYAARTPTLYHFNKTSDNLVILVFNQEITRKYKSFFSDGNAASQYSRITGVISDALKFDWETIFSRGRTTKDNYEIIRKRNAELLVCGPIKVDDYIEKIIVQSSETERNLKELFPQYSNIIKIDNTYF